MTNNRYLSRVMRKQTFCICENKGADQVRGYRLQKYISTQSQTNLIEGKVVFLRDTGFGIDSIFSTLKINRILLNFLSLHIYWP